MYVLPFLQKKNEAGVCPPVLRPPRTVRLQAVALLVCLLFCACGIDNYIYLYRVETYFNKPNSSNDFARNYCAFQTPDTENNNSAPGYFRGFEIYYRIYTSLSVLESEIYAINSYNEDDSTRAMAFSYLTGTYRYKRLAASGRLTDMPLIPAWSGPDRAAVVRIYHSDGSYRAGVRVYGIGPVFPEDGTLLADYGLPRRTVGGITRNTRDYEFHTAEISSGDDDVSWTAGTGTVEECYVQFYAVTYGYDDTFTNIYSELFDLGYITLNRDWDRDQSRSTDPH